jgi:hypothetical protein
VHVAGVGLPRQNDAVPNRLSHLAVCTRDGACRIYSAQKPLFTEVCHVKSLLSAIERPTSERSIRPADVQLATLALRNDRTSLLCSQKSELRQALRHSTWVCGGLRRFPSCDAREDAEGQVKSCPPKLTFSELAVLPRCRENVERMAASCHDGQTGRWRARRLCCRCPTLVRHQLVSAQVDEARSPLIL